MFETKVEMVMNTKKQNLLGINPDTLKPAESWVKPTNGEVRTVIQSLGMSGSQVAKLLGLSDGRNVRYWQGKTDDQSTTSSIPYSAWAWLIYKAGLGIIIE